jgi:hypothetical protein
VVEDVLLSVAGLLFCGLAIVTVAVEREADYSLQSLGSGVCISPAAMPISQTNSRQPCPKA